MRYDVIKNRIHLFNVIQNVNAIVTGIFSCSLNK